jgi:elongation factor P
VEALPHGIHRTNGDTDVATTADFRNGFTLQMDGDLYTITYFQHVKPGKGGAFVRTKLKNVLSGSVIEKTFRAGERVQEVRLERRPVQYSYTDGHLYHFMDQETFEMIPLSSDVIGEDQLRYLKENMECEGLVHGDKVIAVELPYFVELEVAETDPGLRGDTAQGGTKPAKLETGAVVQVPLFIEQGETLRVDRREDKYIERVGK